MSWQNEIDVFFPRQVKLFSAQDAWKNLRNNVITTSQKDQRGSHQSTEVIKLETLGIYFLRLLSNKVIEKKAVAHWKHWTLKKKTGK